MTLTSAVSEPVTLSPAGGVPVALTVLFSIPVASSSICATSVIFVVSLASNGPTLVHVIVPSCMSAGGSEKTYVSPADSLSSTSTGSSMQSPLFVTIIVKLTLVDGAPEDGDAVFVTEMAGASSEPNFWIRLLP